MHRPEFTGNKDKALVNWEPSIVEQFRPPKVVDKPGDFEIKNFEKDVESVTSFHDRLARSTPEEVHRSFLQAVLRSLDDDHVGMYSCFHSYAVYTMGYFHDETIRLAHMYARRSVRRQNLMSRRFTTCLDSRKTGHRVQREVFNKDSKRFGWPLPECLRQSDDEKFPRNEIPKRDRTLAPFVLDALQDFGREVERSVLVKYKELGDTPGTGSGLRKQDEDLLKPYQRFSENLSKMESLHIDEFLRQVLRELKMIEDHVKARQREWAETFRSQVSHKKVPASTRRTAIAIIRQKFASGPDVPHISLISNVAAIRASYAYKQCKSENSTFAFALAFEELCRIKAQESGGSTLDRDFAELMAVPKSAVRVLSALRASIY
jgi:RNA-dependent RNA polymerase